MEDFKKRKVNNSVKPLRKSWRLIQLMTAIEEKQGLSPLNIVKNSKSVGDCANTYSCRNEVIYKNTYITNPLVQNNKIIKVVSPLQVSHSFADSVTLPTKVFYERFPINANFVAQWLSENIVSSKTYKLSLLCDRVIKLANINKRIELLKESNAKSLISHSYAEPKVEQSCNVDSKYTPIVFKLVGIKIVISGRILGAEIATSKTFKTGQIPNNTIKILKDRGFALAKTRSGTIGIKVTYFWSTQLR